MVLVVLPRTPIRFVVFAAFIACIMAGYFIYRYAIMRPAHLLIEGQKAIETGDFSEVGRIIDLLEDEDDFQSAHLLRGRAYLYGAEASLKAEKLGPPNQSPSSQGLFRKALAELDKIS